MRFRRMLLRAGIPPVCGARLPGAPATNDSRCLREGVLVDDSAHRRRYGTALHADHIVPHGGDEWRRLDVLNIQLLCATDHQKKTQLQRQGPIYGSKSDPWGGTATDRKSVV